MFGGSRNAVGASCRNVVILNDFAYVQGGASRVAIDEALALASLGLQVTFLGAVGPVAPALCQASLRTVCLEQSPLRDNGASPLAALQSMWNRAAVRAIDAVLAALDPACTIVHLHGYTKALSAGPVAHARAAGFAVLCTLHDFFAACPNGAFYDYRAASPCLRVALSGACVARHCDKRHRAHKLFRVARALVQRHLAGFPVCVQDYVVLSQQSQKVLRPYLPPLARIHALPHGIDVARKPAAAVATSRELVCIGRLEAEKGVRLLAQTAAALGLTVTFVGDGPLRGEVAQFAGMTVTGWLGAQQVQERLDAARCLVFPSLWYETYGLVVAEAAARGVPAVVSDVAAPSERITDGVDGWIFRSGDPVSLAAALSRVMDDDVVRRAGRAAYERFWAKPVGPADHAVSLLDVYDRVLGASARGSSVRRADIPAGPLPAGPLAEAGAPGGGAGPGAE